MLKNLLNTPFSLDDVTVESRETLFKGFFQIEKLALKHRLYQGGWSPTIHRELFVRGDGVGAVLYDPVHELIGLVQQFRVGVMSQQDNPWVLEVVAGMAEEGESAQEVIVRELQEEAGIKASELRFICDYFSSPGGTDEKLSLFCALADLSSAEGYYGLENEAEDIRLVVLPQQVVFDELYNGAFNNAATLICLQWLLMKHKLLTPELKG